LANLPRVLSFGLGAPAGNTSVAARWCSAAAACNLRFTSASLLPEATGRQGARPERSQPVKLRELALIAVSDKT
jgi:hypothetical protein